MGKEEELEAGKEEAMSSWAHKQGQGQGEQGKPGSRDDPTLSQCREGEPPGHGTLGTWLASPWSLPSM